MDGLSKWASDELMTDVQTARDIALTAVDFVEGSIDGTIAAVFGEIRLLCRLERAKLAVGSGTTGMFGDADEGLPKTRHPSYQEHHVDRPGS